MSIISLKMLIMSCSLIVMSNIQYLFCVHAKVTKNEFAAAEMACELAEWNVVSWENVETGEVIFEEYFEDEDGAVKREAQMDELFSSILEEEWSVELKRLESRDWTEYWKRFFHAERVTERIIIKPSWEEYEEAPQDVLIELDPGMSFGTGQHPTTRMCLSYIDEISREYEGSSLLDLGCGSGVLAIAAKKLGFSPVAGIDYDPLAVKIAEDNARKNGLGGQLSLSVQDLGSAEIDEQFDVVVINMIASLLKQFAAPAVKLLKQSDSSVMILSGMLKEQYDETYKIYNALGISMIRTKEYGEWISALCKIS